jgi:hypothetical protein
MNTGHDCFCLAFLRDGTIGIAPIASAAARNAATSQAMSARTQACTLGRRFISCSKAASSCAWPGIRTMTVDEFRDLL